jgi:arylsulfatase A-like enzyme
MAARYSILMILAFMISCHPGGHPEPHPDRPNIILIMADDLGYEGLSCNGGGSYRTPNLDELARTGIRFTRCFSTPLCTPSRVQLMTGQYSFRNYTEFGSLRPGEITFAHLLKDAGYATCVAGKWQLAGHYEGSNYRGVGTLPEQAGFDEHCLWQIDRLGSRYWDPEIVQNGTLRQDLSGRFGPDVVCDFVIEFLQKSRQGPFFIYYPMILTHSPFMPTPSTDIEPDLRSKPDKKHFADMVAHADRLVGRIVAALDGSGLRESTLILFTGDNGTPRGIVSQLSGRPIPGGKGFTTASGTHVPLIAQWQGKTLPGTVCGDLIDFTDFLPTLCQASGANLPGGIPFDGRSFLPQIRGETGNPRDWIFCHYDPRWGQWKPQRFAQNSRWKLYGDGSLYDIEADPDETLPLDPNRPSAEAEAARSELQAVLDRMQ